MRGKTCFPNLGGGKFYLGKHIEKIEHEGIGTGARTEVSQDTDNAD